MRQEEWTVEAADAYLNEIPKFTSEKHTAEGLRRMLSYLKALPQEERIVHVAGTNGKGAVCSFLDAVLQKAGKRTARFTSPHLVRVTERFSFDGQEADDALFLEAFEVVKASYVHFELEGLGHPTYFEYLFLMFMPEKAGVCDSGNGAWRTAGCNELHRASSAYGYHFDQP